MSFVCKVVSTFSVTSQLMPSLMKLVNQGHSCRQASQSVYFFLSFHFLRTVWQIFYECWIWDHNIVDNVHNKSFSRKQKHWMSSCVSGHEGRE